MVHYKYRNISICCKGLWTACRYMPSDRGFLQGCKLRTKKNRMANKYFSCFQGTLHYTTQHYTALFQSCTELHCSQTGRDRRHSRDFCNVHVCTKHHCFYEFFAPHAQNEVWLCLSVSFNFRTAGQILMKFDTNVMSLEATPYLYFSVSQLITKNAK